MKHLKHALKHLRKPCEARAALNVTRGGGCPTDTGRRRIYTEARHQKVRREMQHPIYF
jgi:hypothetical protein